MTTHRSGRAALNEDALVTVTFGIEEEFVLLRPGTLTTADVGLQAVQELQDACPGVIVREFMASQIEFATPVTATAAESMEAVSAFRFELGEWAAAHNVIAAGTGTPFLARPMVEGWEGRYREIADHVQLLSAGHHINGQHVHVAISDAEAGVRAMNALRPWLPILLALSSNSPFWQGVDTGFASWRAMHSRRWTTYGIPPWFTSAKEYDRTVAAQIGIGATLDAGCINWSARLSQTHPTLEVRVCDVQLDPASAVALALIIRALVVDGEDQEVPRPHEPDLVDAALWQAAREGVGGLLVDPVTGSMVSAQAVVDRLRDHLSLSEGDALIVDAFLLGISRTGSGARRQREALEEGTSRLGALYSDSLSSFAYDRRPLLAGHRSPQSDHQVTI